MNVELFLRPAEEIWCVSTRMVAIYVYPEQTQCIDHHIWTLIQIFIHRPQHQALFLTTLLLQDLWSVDLVTSWMKTISVLVRSGNLCSILLLLLKLVWHCGNNCPLVIESLKPSVLKFSYTFFKGCELYVSYSHYLMQAKIRFYYLISLII